MASEVIVVGAGLWGCVVARRLAEAGLRVRIVEERAWIGGNCRAVVDAETGAECHQYGAHIFHTSSQRVWDFVRRYTDFTSYRHQVLTVRNGRVYFLPLGLPLINAFYGLNLTPPDVPAFIAGEVAKSGLDPKIAPRNLEEKAISLIGRPLYEAFIQGYTWKQWNTDPRRLPESIINRLPVRADYNVNYYSDPWQGLPAEGFGALFDRLVDHPAIGVQCGTDFFAAKASLPADAPVFYSGAIDRFFGYRFGELPWRGLRFRWEHKNVADFQGTSVMNYAEREVSWTRIHEFKHFHPEWSARYTPGKTILCYEYPSDWKKGDEPFYPVQTAEADETLRAYRAEAARCPQVVFGGRLGEYRYYDMDATVKRALEQADEFLKRLS